MYEIGSWRFEPATATLRRDRVAKPLEDRCARVLEILCRRRGEVVSKDELLNSVWSGRRVSPNSVAIAIGALRRALEEDASEPAHLLTVGKRGYRLVEAVNQSAPVPPRARSSRIWPRTWIALALALGGAFGGTAILYRARSPQPVELLVTATGNETGQADKEALARSLSAVVADRAARFPDVHVRLQGGPVPPGTARVLLRSRLILWAGAPELAMTAVDPADGSVLWSAFAAGPPATLARSAAAKLDGLQRRLAGPRPASGRPHL